MYCDTDKHCVPYMYCVIDMHPPKNPFYWIWIDGYYYGNENDYQWRNGRIIPHSSSFWPGKYMQNFPIAERHCIMLNHLML